MAPTIESTAKLQEALARAEPRGPAALPDGDPGAALALACHCVMVDSGLRPALPGGGANPANPWAPAPRWAAEFRDEWLFKYAPPRGKRNPLALHCSLQRVTGRMLVHTMELGLADERATNSHLLGLQLQRYVPGSAEALAAASSWEGAVVNAEAMVPMLQAHALAPLLDKAEDAPAADAADWVSDAPGGGRGWLAGWWSRPAGAGAGEAPPSYVLPAVAVTALALAGVAVFVVARQRRGGAR